MKAPEAPINPELLVHCPLPNEIPLMASEDATEQLKIAMQIATENNKIIAHCYLMQKNLVNAVLRRQQTN